MIDILTEDTIAYDEGSFHSASDALWFLNRELEHRAEQGDAEAIRFIGEMNRWDNE